MKTIMLRETERRMTELGLPAEEYPVCFTAGVRSELTDEDKKAIEDIEDQGNIVYLVTHDYCDGVLMNNYVYTGGYREDWPYEFQCADESMAQVMAFVASELTHGTYDMGTIAISHQDGKFMRPPELY